MGADFYRHGEPEADEGSHAPRLLVVFQKQHLHGHEQVESQRTKPVVKRVGLIGEAGRVVEVHVPKELVEAVFLGPFEVVAFKHQPGGGWFVDLFALELTDQPQPRSSSRLRY